MQSKKRQKNDEQGEKQRCYSNVAKSDKIIPVPWCYLSSVQWR